MINVSVIIPVFNASSYIEKCATCLFEQTLQSIEFIFVDDCSSDCSIDIIKKVLQSYPNRKQHVTIVTHNKNMGVAIARKTGHALANGKYLIDCDSDDYPDKTMYEILFNKAEETHADIVICGWKEIYNDNVKYYHPPKTYNNLDALLNLFTGKLHSSLSNKLVQSDLYKTRKISFIEDVNFMEDFSVVYKLLFYAQNIEYISLPLYNYNKRNTNSYTSTNLSTKSQIGLLRLDKNICDFWKENRVNNTNILAAFSLWESKVLSLILMRGNLNTLKSAKGYFQHVSIPTIIKHPTMMMSYKVIAIFYILHCYSLVKIIKFSYDAFRKFKK